MEGWARDMHRKGAAERSQVIDMRIFHPEELHPGIYTQGACLTVQLVSMPRKR